MARSQPSPISGDESGPPDGAGGGPPPDSSGGGTGRLTGGDAIRLHLTLAAGLALCVGAFIFELLRALGGHTFSWLYVFEWPVFAGFALYMWWSLLNGHDRRRPAAPTGAPEPGPHAATEVTARVDPAREERPLVEGSAGDEDLSAWNHYLRQREAAEAAEDGAPD